MSVTELAELKWLSRLGKLCQDLHQPQSAESKTQTLGELWLLLISSISQYLRFHSSRLGALSREDLEDVAAEKSSDLLQRIEVRAWDVTGWRPEEITGFLSKVARNGLVDRLRATRRLVGLVQEGETGLTEDGLTLRASSSMMNPATSPQNAFERKEFAGALRECAEGLDGRSRLIWFFRVLCAMSSKEIAGHPRIALTVNHVDVLFHRARRAIKDCMRRRGFQPGDMPPGTFVELWESCRLDEVQP